MRSFAFFPESRVSACLWQYSLAMKTVFPQTALLPENNRYFASFLLNLCNPSQPLIPDIFLAVKPIRPHILATPKPITLEKA